VYPTGAAATVRAGDERCPSPALADQRVPVPEPLPEPVPLPVDPPLPMDPLLPVEPLPVEPLVDEPDVEPPVVDELPVLESLPEPTPVLPLVLPLPDGEADGVVLPVPLLRSLPSRAQAVTATTIASARNPEIMRCISHLLLVPRTLVCEARAMSSAGRASKSTRRAWREQLHRGKPRPVAPGVHRARRHDADCALSALHDLRPPAAAALGSDHRRRRVVPPDVPRATDAPAAGVVSRPSARSTRSAVIG
jgi:hypothetical protein